MVLNADKTKLLTDCLLLSILDTAEYQLVVLEAKCNICK